MRPILLVGIGLLTACISVPSVMEERTDARASAADPELCAEHQVLESVCTQCNASLIPVFQASGDWCPEHGFPESFCPICNPEAGGRPAVQDVSPDGSPADGTVIRFKTREAANLAGIEVAKAVEAPWSGGAEAVVRLTWDATRVALVSAPSPGLVASIKADVGTVVEPGDVLATLRSAQVGGERSRRSAARRAVGIAEAELARKQDLLKTGVSSQRDVLAAEKVLVGAQSDLDAIEYGLRIVGGGAGNGFALTSPFGGVVTERNAYAGQSVRSQDPLFQVVDPSEMWAELEVAEADLGSVAVGQAVRIVLDALPDQTFEGRLSYLAPSVDPRTRTVRARVVLDNHDRVLRAHMYGAAHIDTDVQTTVVVVPTAAVQVAEDVHLVFVRQAQDSFVARRVRVIARSGDKVRVAGPIKPGDPVATTGSFLLKTETLKDSIGAGCCDVE